MNAPLIVHPAAPIDPHQLLIFLLQCGLLLLLAVILSSTAVRFGMPAVAGELLAGVLLGPSVLAAIAPSVEGWLVPQSASQLHLLDAVGQVSVLLLVGLTGIQIDLDLIRRQGATAARVGLTGLIIPLALGVALGLLLPAQLATGSGGRPVFALFLGVAMCVSAIPVISKILMDMDLLHRNVGQLTLAVGIIDDAVGWLLLSVVSALVTSGVRGGDIVRSVAYLLLFAAASFTVGRLFLRRVFEFLSPRIGSSQMIAVIVVMVLLGSAITQALGLEAVVGAFVTGTVIGSSKALDRSQLRPLGIMVTAVFAPLFFATVGLRMDLTALAHPALLLAALAVLLVATVGKFVGAFIGALVSKLNRWEAVALGGAINARGVIQIVVASVGLRLGVLTTETYTIIILIAVATSLMAPPILSWAMSHVTYEPEEQSRRERLVVTPGGY